MIIVAPDKFKGSLSATRVAAVIAERLRASGNHHVIELPIADGGEGTVDVAIRAGMDRVTTSVNGPLGQPLDATYARDDRVAVIELASAAGLSCLGRQPNVETAGAASTFGVGQLIAHAVAGGATTVVVGLGGSASTDGGAGLAAALGAILSTGDQTSVGPGGVGLGTITAVDLGPMLAALDGVEIVLACDVDNPLVGPHGAAAVYGPQKGADDPLVAQLDKNLRHWADLVYQVTGVDVAQRPGAGAAGGAGLVLLAAGCARIEAGSTYLLNLTGAAERFRDADVVIIGEGSLDHQSLRGKGPISVARFAKSNGAKVIAVVGMSSLTTSDLNEAPIDRVYALTDIEPDLDRCINDPEPILRELTGRLLADGVVVCGLEQAR